MVSQGDYLQRFHFKELPVRGALVSLSATLNQLLTLRTYPDPVACLLSEILSANLLMSSTIKWQGQLILQYQGQPGAGLELLLAKSNDQHEVSALARWNEEAFTDSTRLLMNGQLVISILQESNREPYQSIVELTGAGFEQCIQEYFQELERIDTRLCLLGLPDRACGLILQKMPGQDCDFDALTATLDHGLVDFSLSIKDLLRTLFPEQDCYINDPESVLFQCQCSLDKMKQALLFAGEQEVLEELSLNPDITVMCEFCGHEYTFSKNEVDAIFSEQSNGSEH